DERVFPKKSALGMQVLTLFAAPFVTPSMEPGYPRDLLLRGRHSSALEKLVSERSSWRSALEQRANNDGLEAKLQAWVDEATRTYANLVRAKTPLERAAAEKQVKTLWESPSSLAVRILINSSAAGARIPEVDYQLGLCTQEEAEQIQARLDLQARIGATALASDVEKAKGNWQHAIDNWKSFEDEYPNHPDIFAARRLRGWAEAMVGDSKAAVTTWKKTANAPSELEKLASLFLAQQWEKKHASKGK
ncbi:MAG TPA: hypothetical protein VFA15_09170, partial [Nitrososphaera sp.]|nr:hypothetical protein [Nitrososphaera sp.]